MSGGQLVTPTPAFQDAQPILSPMNQVPGLASILLECRGVGQVGSSG